MVWRLLRLTGSESELKTRKSDGWRELRVARVLLDFERSFTLMPTDAVGPRAVVFGE